MNLSDRDLYIINELEKLASKDELFFTKHNANDFAKMFNITINSIYDLFYRANISLREKRKDEFLNYFNKQNLNELKLEKIKNDLKFKNKQAVTNKIKFIFGISLREIKNEYK